VYAEQNVSHPTLQDRLQYLLVRCTEFMRGSET
jgi:hypothetical protein